MKISVRESQLPGCLELHSERYKDQRGSFVKVFHAPTFQAVGLPTDYPEAYYSVSRRNVIRGLHFQLPPADHYKLVTCLHGTAWDVAVDLRRRSPTYGQWTAFKLEAQRPTIVALPPGLAHGFLTLSSRCLLYYQTTTVHEPELDAGIHWNSAGISWPLEDEPIVSKRDDGLPLLERFDSPFTFSEGK